MNQFIRLINVKKNRFKFNRHFLLIIISLFILDNLAQAADFISDITSVCSGPTTFTQETKTLNLKSVMLQGLYKGSGEMKQAWDEYGPNWEEGVADHITVELHSSTNYSEIVYLAEDVPLNTDGTATVSIPSQHGDSYYITIKHRNSIEITTVRAVSFASVTISQPFASKNSVYGKNLYKSDDGYYLIYTGDVNQDGFIDKQDFIGVDNDSYNYRSGYLVTDLDGNGVIDTNDYIFIDNNNYNNIGTIHP